MVPIKESTSNISIKQPFQNQSSLDTNKTNQDETKISESSLSGPNMSSVKSYDRPIFSANSSSSSYKEYSLASTSKSSAEILVKKVESNEEVPTSKEPETTLYKPLNYSLLASPINVMATKTVSVKTNGSSSTTVTNNFKLPPFPVYVPSTTLPSTTESVLKNKIELSTTPVTLKFSDAPSSSSVMTAPSSTLSRLSDSALSTSTNNVNNTSTLPLNLGRNNPYLYQSESNFNSSNVTLTSKAKSNLTSSFTNPVTSSFLSLQSSYNNVYSTLPKTTGSSTYICKYDADVDNTKSSASYKYSTDYSNISSTNGTSTFANSSSDKNVHSTANMYSVQYSATNPFLDPVDPSNNTDNSESSLLRGGVSEMKKKFEKLGSEEDLK